MKAGIYFIIKNKMKYFINLALLIATVSAAASSQCMYCRRLDEGAGFLVTFSYCNQTDICLQNAWNYIQRDCVDGWQRGNSYELDYCQPNVISCPEFTSTPDKYQIYQNDSWSLAQGGMCTIKIDATEGVGRVIFKNTSVLGIEWDGAEIGDVISIAEGEIAEIPIYNGAQTGPLTFDISFSGAGSLMAGAAALAMIAFVN